VPSFLQPLLRQPQRGWTLIDATTGAHLAGRVVAAVDSITRRRGLLGRTDFQNEALIIAPCSAVHTFFMQIPIDILFVTRDGRITRAVNNVVPWRVAVSLSAFATIEMPSGTLARTGTTGGHVVTLRED
jgi:uncharacterized membrane protein (UPF0127 family)